MENPLRTAWRISGAIVTGTVLAAAALVALAVGLVLAGTDATAAEVAGIRTGLCCGTMMFGGLVGLFVHSDVLYPRVRRALVLHEARRRETDG